jgi:anti-anti-sigma factor
MKRHLTTSANSRTRSTIGTGGAVAGRAHGAFKGSARTREGLGAARLALATSSLWTHTLVLRGELDHRSAHALEAEIERLCEQGVTGITLDLRELDYLDAIGVAVIVFRCGHCRKHGFDFTLIPGSAAVQDAFEQAGVSDSLPFREPEPATSRPPSRTPANAVEIVAEVPAPDAREVVAEAPEIVTEAPEVLGPRTEQAP